MTRQFLCMPQKQICKKATNCFSHWWPISASLPALNSNDKVMIHLHVCRTIKPLIGHQKQILRKGYNCFSHWWPVSASLPAHNSIDKGMIHLNECRTINPWTGHTISLSCKALWVAEASPAGGSKFSDSASVSVLLGLFRCSWWKK